ncbi:hypothetical protein MuYL_1980 [Mucilaginibacter xinganensis]|uniref:Uncharacterized protein n=1 Tax=Mucilaginibacter xinganensis TaxID=1234841 RepID=A0A223NVG6_9SPHI|nr:hypothetical protein MuYL_1980 [Mucilaginibacter xinganensis]
MRFLPAVTGIAANNQVKSRLSERKKLPITFTLKTILFGHG